MQPVINQTLTFEEGLQLLTSPLGCLRGCQTNFNSQAQANDASSVCHELTRDGSVSHDTKDSEDGADNSNDHDDCGNLNSRDTCTKEHISDDAANAQTQDGADEGLSALGVGTSCGTFASTTESSGTRREQGKRGGLLTGGLAASLSGHWRAAELQFEDTARRVRSDYFFRVVGVTNVGVGQLRCFTRVPLFRTSLSRGILYALPPSIKQTRALEAIVCSYCCVYVHIQAFRELRNQRLLIDGHVRTLRDAFSAFLRRPDNKQGNMAEFCSSFNTIDQVYHLRQTSRGTTGLVASDG